MIALRIREKINTDDVGKVSMSRDHRLITSCANVRVKPKTETKLTHKERN